MRIVAGVWRGRALAAPSGDATRPTADRVRQALFDMLWHAPWAGRGAIEGTCVLDAFAGTGALGLEALSRGAAHATFFERDRTALATLRHNVAACGAGQASTIHSGDALRPGPARRACGLVFLDPPYGQGLVERATAALAGAGWFAHDAIVVAETECDAALTLDGDRLAERTHGRARLSVWRINSRTRPIDPTQGHDVTG